MSIMVRRRRYTIPEAAHCLGITPESVLGAIRRGRLRARLKTVRVPRKIWSIAAESVEAYVVSASHQERGLKKAL
ncbi:MAG: helix-turn-helix domain-containing protein [Nitrospirae bacterium]|nr:helix-turn-helix domain-containing protein [Nitrospirota bacterium]